MKIAVVSGGFDPLHSGHINLLRNAAEIGDRLVVGLNSHEWLKRKKGKPFLSFNERKIILESMSYVDEVLSFDDSDNTACNLLKAVKRLWPDDEIIFCNGGDRVEGNVPEASVEGIKFIFDAGGNEKVNSSSTILKDWLDNSVTRIWGRYSVLYDKVFNQNQHVKVKELVIEPGKNISLQKHLHRNEFWLIVEGECVVYDSIAAKLLHKDEFIFVPKETVHQIKNISDKTCHIIEIQYGNKCIEEDIVRFTT